MTRKRFHPRPILRNQRGITLIELGLFLGMAVTILVGVAVFSAQVAEAERQSQTAEVRGAAPSDLPPPVVPETVAAAKPSVSQSAAPEPRLVAPGAPLSAVSGTYADLDTGFVHDLQGSSYEQAAMDKLCAVLGRGITATSWAWSPAMIAHDGTLEGLLSYTHSSNQAQQTWAKDPSSWANGHAPVLARLSCR